LLLETVDMNKTFHLWIQNMQFINGFYC
jgi:hypothetical protein